MQVTQLVFTVIIFEIILVVLIALLFVAVRLIDHLLVISFLKKFKQNLYTEVVIILGQSDWSKIKSWFKFNFLKSEIKSLTTYLLAKEQNFSFFQKATFEDINQIMRNKDVKEVYFFGHGDSHSFKLKGATSYTIVILVTQESMAKNSFIKCIVVCPSEKV